MAPTKWACKGGKLPTGELLILQPDLNRALTITGSTSSSITLIKGVTISNGACQLSGKRGRAEVLPGACTFVAKGCSPNGRHAILEHKALTEDAQGPAGLRKYVSWQVASGCAAGSLEVPEALEEELNEEGEGPRSYTFEWLRAGPARICCNESYGDDEGSCGSVVKYDSSFKAVASSDDDPSQEDMQESFSGNFIASPDGKLLVGTASGLRLLRASTCKAMATLEGLGIYPSSFHWTPDSSKLLAVRGSSAHLSQRRSVERLDLIDAQAKTKKVVSSAKPPSPLQAVIGWGLGQSGPVLLCAGVPAAGADNPCPVQSMSLQGSSWGSLSSPVPSAAVYVTSESEALASLSPSAKHLALVSAASLSSAWSVQFLDVAAGSVIAEWAAPASSVLGQDEHSISLEWAQSGQRLVLKTGKASFLIELEAQLSG